MATFKDRLKQLRLEKNLTLKEIGTVLGLSESSMSLYESGKREPKTTTDFIKIADCFGVTLDYLIGRTDDANVKRYATILDDDRYAIAIYKKYPHKLSPEEVEKLINKLKECRFDVDGLIKDIKNQK